MDLVCFILFIVLYYVRPQEWYGFLANLQPMKILSLVTVLALFTRERKVTLGDLFRTPVDWLVWGLIAWAIFTNASPKAAAQMLQAHILCYALGVFAVTSVVRLNKVLLWWGIAVLFIGALAVLSTVGVDPLGSRDLTEGMMQGRLALRLSIFNNPNALAHSVVPAVPLLFFVLFWRRVFLKAAAVVLLVPLYCIFLTESKGAFLSVALTLLATLTFGRPKWAQVLILTLAIGLGSGALWALPRMGELQRTRGNQAIQGRVAAYRFGLWCMERYTTGVGLATFQEAFFQNGPLESIRDDRTVQGRHQVRYVTRHYRKAAHSAYSQTGAELGYTGFFLFIGVMYACARTLLTTTTRDPDLERARRALFCVLISYAVSSWMVDFYFRATFFVLAACVSAFHRLARAQMAPALGASGAAGDGSPAVATPVFEPLPAGGPMPAAALAAPAATAAGVPPARSQLAAPGMVAAPRNPPELADAPLAVPAGGGELAEPAAAHPSLLRWRRLTLVDFVLIFLAMQVAIRIWRQIISEV